jgi:hypothetical protein
MEEQNHEGLPVTGTGANKLGSHQVDEKPMAILDGPQTEFVLTLAGILGMNEKWVLDFIVATYEQRFGYEHPDYDVSKEEPGETPTSEAQERA